VAVALAARGARGAILAGIATSTVLGLVFGILDGPSGVAQLPDGSSFSTIGDALDPSNLSGALTWALVPVIFALFMSDFFDTVGTATAVASGGGLTDENGNVPGIKRLLLVDSAAALGGGAMGVSSVTFALTIFFVPIIALVGQSVGKAGLHPATAPALVLVGYLMLRLAGDIDWKRAESAIPAFLVIVGIPMTFSIAAGIGFGVLGYVVVKAAQGRARDVHPLMWCLVPLFVAFYASDWLSVNVF
jgi:AGZA family xanthine/uracil permease-like MFS transporter